MKKYRFKIVSFNNSTQNWMVCTQKVFNIKLFDHNHAHKYLSNLLKAWSLSVAIINKIYVVTSDP
jgi:hypothetical protein